MRLITACCARVPQRWTSRIYIHFLLMFQEVRLISKTRNQLRGISQQRATTLTTGSTPPLGWLPLYSPHDQAGYPTTHSQEPYP